MKSLSDKILNALIRFFHETLGLSPNQISTIALVIGLIAAGVVASGFILPGLLLMALSQIVDGVDGGVARKYKLQSQRGQILETVYDRTCELSIFLALAYIGLVTLQMALLAFVAILLITVLEPISKFDPGFKRFMIYFGYLATVYIHVNGFQIAMHVIFWANLAAFAIGTIMVDYEFQKEIDHQAMIRKEKELALGIPQPPDDPPSFLSKLFSGKQ